MLKRAYMLRVTNGLNKVNTDSTHFATHSVKTAISLGKSVIFFYTQLCLFALILRAASESMINFLA